MRWRSAAYLAAAWAIVFAVPHLYWATGRTEGLGTALNADVVRDAGVGMAVSCGAIALFCLCGAAAALGTAHDWPERFGRRVRRALVGLTWFGAVLLITRSVDIYVVFTLALTGVQHVPAAQQADFVHLSRWFMFLYLPWFTLGAIAWTRLAWRYPRAGRPAGPAHHVSRSDQSGPTTTTPHGDASVY